MRSKFFVLLFLFTSVFCSAQRTETLTVYFGFNEHTLALDSKRRIDILISNRSVIEVQISAHCDSIGNDNHNDALSLKRAMEVKQYLVSKKLDGSLINVTASGKRIPLNKNETEQERSLNRRAEITFILKEAEAVVQPVVPPVDTMILPTKDSLADIIPARKADTVAKDIQNLNIDSLEIGSTFRLSNLNFVGGRHKLSSKSTQTLELLLKIMKENPGLVIEIHGYVCCTADHEDGFDYDTGTNNLSWNRAKAVYEYLISKGIDRMRLRYRGFGGDHKLVIERTEADRAMNRRVEIKILKK